MLQHTVSTLLRNDVILGISRSAIKKAGHEEARKKITFIQKSELRKISI